jgi:hypothetical protein
MNYQFRSFKISTEEKLKDLRSLNAANCVRNLFEVISLYYKCQFDVSVLAISEAPRNRERQKWETLQLLREYTDSEGSQAMPARPFGKMGYRIEIVGKY